MKICIRIASELKCYCRGIFRKSAGSGSAEEERDAGEHVEDDYGRESDAADEAYEEVGDLGKRGENCCNAADEKVGDFQRPTGRHSTGGQFAGEKQRLGEDHPQRTVAGAGRAESESGSVHQEVQRGDAAPAPEFFQGLHGDDKPDQQTTASNLVATSPIKQNRGALCPPSLLSTPIQSKPEFFSPLST